MLASQPNQVLKGVSNFMLDTMTRYLTGFGAITERRALRYVFEPIVDRYSSQALVSAGLVIKAGGSTLAKTGSSTFVAIANGTLVSIAASTDMPALSGSITAGSYNVFCFFVDSAGTTTSAMGTEGTTLAKVKFPPIPLGKALIGFLVVTYASTFVGGTTALDTATTIYCSPTGAFDPSVRV